MIDVCSEQKKNKHKAKRTSIFDISVFVQYVIRQNIAGAIQSNKFKYKSSTTAGAVQIEANLREQLSDRLYFGREHRR